MCADGFFLGSEINQVGMGGVSNRRARLVQALHGTMYVHPRRRLVHKHYFFVTAIPGTHKKPFYGQKKQKVVKSKFLAGIFGLLQ